MIIAGAENRPPMLEKSLYDSWKSRMELYIENQENMKMILNSLQKGPLVWPTIVEEDGTTSTKKSCYSCVNQGDDPISCLDKAMPFLKAVTSSRVTMQQVQGRQGQSYAGNIHKGNDISSRRNNAGGQTRVVKCYNCLDEEQLAFVADLGIQDGQATQTTIPNTVAFQTEDLDAYDSDCDDVFNVKAVLMANLFNYGSDVISKEKANQDKNDESLTAEIDRYKERVKTFEQRLNIDLSTPKK
uniref:Gag-Pol polyprotein n=1 Tax=Tanacetum cinerariifolium TaxID=118510 RepID=A0A6L2NIM1_TANCI|nr:hypothetical protein [Tanacetum cinerariifolium]